MRVLFLATRDWYNPATTGGDNTLWENARYLASAGHSVTFVAARFPGSAREETIDGIRVVRLGGIHSMWLRSFVYYLSRGRGRFDVVVAEGFGGSRVPRLAPLYVKEPLITEWHQVHRNLFAVQYPRLMNGPLNILERLTVGVHRNTRVRAGTDDVREAFTKIGFKRENVFVVPVSIRDEWINGSTAHPASSPSILWLGKLRRYKCPDHMVRAMVEVVKNIPSARLTIAGRRDDVNYEHELRRLAARLDLGDHVDFRFDLTEAEKLDLYRASRVVVVTSAVEGFGIVVLEANACGLPVIASSGVPLGALEEGVNGLRYPFGDVEALSRRIVELLSDETLYAQLSESALKRVTAYSWSKVGAQFERVVEQAVAR